MDSVDNWPIISIRRHGQPVRHYDFFKASVIREEVFPIRQNKPVDNSRLIHIVHKTLVRKERGTCRIGRTSLGISRSVP